MLLLLLLLLLHRLCLLLLKELRLVVSFFALYEFVATAEQIVQGSAFELRHLALRFYWFRRFGFLGGEKSRSRLLLEIANRRGMRRNGYDYLVPACHVWRIDRKFSFFLAFAWHGRYGQGKLDVLDACGVCVRVVNVKMGVTRRKRCTGREHGSRIDFWYRALVGELLLELLHVDGEWARQLHPLTKNALQRPYPVVCATRE